MKTQVTIKANVIYTVSQKTSHFFNRYNFNTNIPIYTKPGRQIEESLSYRMHVVFLKLVDLIFWFSHSSDMYAKPCVFFRKLWVVVLKRTSWWNGGGSEKSRSFIADAQTDAPLPSHTIVVELSTDQWLCPRLTGWRLTMLQWGVLSGQPCQDWSLVNYVFHQTPHSVIHWIKVGGTCQHCSPSTCTDL